MAPQTEVPQPIPPPPAPPALLWRVLPWLPFALALSGLVALGLAGRLDHGLEFLLALGALGAAWLLGRRLWPPALIALAVLTPLAWQLWVSQPRVAAELARVPPGSHIRIRGTVRGQSPSVPARGERVRLLLGEVELRRGGRGWTLLEVEVFFTAPRGRRRPFYFGRELLIGGALAGARMVGRRVTVELERIEYHLGARPIAPWRGESLRMALRNRAGYYLSEPALAVYLPILLGVRERGSPEAREVVDSFRRVGISHLFAISGLHIGLLLLIFLFAAHLVSGLLLRGQGPLRGRAVSRVAAVALVWGYIALIGFPVPAVRAAIMASMLLWSGLWGTRTLPLYLLWLAGLILVAVTPSIVYNLSFQLSFLSFFFLLFALRMWSSPLDGAREPELPRPGSPRSSGVRAGVFARALSLARLNLAVTLAITVGIWPVVAIHFGQISLLVFLGNLLMIPLLSLVVLPGGLVALLVSLAHLGTLPGGGLERVVFAALEAILTGWLWLIRLIDQAGGGLVVSVRLDWGPRELFLYYALLIGAILLIRQIPGARPLKFFLDRRFSFKSLKIK